MALLDYILPAMWRAQLTGQPVMVPGMGGLAVHPNGSIGTPGGGFTADPTNAGFGPSWAAAPGTAPFAGAPGTREGFVPPQAQSALTPPYQSAISPLPIGQNFARAFPPPQAEPPALAMPQDYGNTGFGTPAFAAAVTPPAAGGPGSRETSVPQQAQSAATRALAANAARYRAAPGGGGGGGLTADQLNAASLAAARAGRTYFNPALNVQPGGNVVNALTMPPAGPYGGTQYAASQLRPIY